MTSDPLLVSHNHGVCGMALGWSVDSAFIGGGGYRGRDGFGDTEGSLVASSRGSRVGAQDGAFLRSTQASECQLRVQKTCDLSHVSVFWTYCDHCTTSVVAVRVVLYSNTIYWGVR